MSNCPYRIHIIIQNPYNYCLMQEFVFIHSDVFKSEVTANVTMNDEINCFANSSQSCSYKWKWFSGDDISTESDTQILKPKKVGWHRCEATCSLGNKLCTVESLYANVYSDAGKTISLRSRNLYRL